MVVTFPCLYHYSFLLIERISIIAIEMDFTENTILGWAVKMA